MASGLFVKRMFFASHSSFPGTCRAMATSASHSAKGALMLKSEHDGSPPLQARTQSRACAEPLSPVLAPGERCASTSNRNFEGRQGRGGRTHLVSPQMAAAAALHGHFVDVRSLAAEAVPA